MGKSFKHTTKIFQRSFQIGERRFHVDVGKFTPGVCQTLHLVRLANYCLRIN